MGLLFLRPDGAIFYDSHQSLKYNDLRGKILEKGLFRAVFVICSVYPEQLSKQEGVNTYDSLVKKQNI